MLINETIITNFVLLPTVFAVAALDESVGGVDEQEGE